jgi:hypothetical protein
MAEKTVEQLMAENAVLKSFVAKAYNKSETEIDGLITDETGVRDDGFENLLTLDTSKTKRLKGDSQTMFDKGYQKAEAEIKSKAEKTFKEKTGFSEDADNFEELLDKYIEQQTKNPKKSALTDDDVKKHPAYLALEKERVPKADFEKVKAEFEDYKAGVSRNEKMNSIKSKVLNKFNSFQIEQIENPTVKAKRTDLFLKEFDGYDYEMDGDNVIIIKDGKRLEDDHGNLVQFDKFIENTAQEHFVFLKQSPKGSAGNGNPDVKTTPAGTVTIKDEAHYAELMAELDSRQAAEKDPAKVIEIRKERAKLGETWMNQSKK